MEERKFKKGQLVQHFKREGLDLGTDEYVYEIIGEAIHSETREKMMEISEDKDHLYVSKLGILSASRCCNPFEPMPVGMLSNVALLGGWKVESAPYNALLEKYGFTDNPYEAIAGTSEQAASVYLLDEDPEATLAFLREYYNPDAQMVETGEWNDKIVRQVVTGPQEEPGRQQNQ